jgi:hypothetical protein
MAALDLTPVDQRSARLYTSKVETDPRNSDHFPISIEYNGTREPRKGSKNASRLHNKDTHWIAFMEIVKEKIMKVKTHIVWNRERNVKENYDNLPR